MRRNQHSDYAQVGAVFGLLTVIEVLPVQNRGRRLCKCACGNEKIVLLRRLREGHAKSCGCLQAATRRFRVHNIPQQAHPLMRKLFTIMNTEHASIEWLARTSGVPAASIKGWRKSIGRGKRYGPKVDNLEACFLALGYRLVAQQVKDEAPEELRETTKRLRLVNYRQAENYP